MITSAGKVLLSKTGGLNYTLCPPFLNNNRESLNARNIVMNSIDVFSVLVVATDPQCQILSNCQKVYIIYIYIYMDTHIYIIVYIQHRRCWRILRNAFINRASIWIYS